MSEWNDEGEPVTEEGVRPGRPLEFVTGAKALGLDPPEPIMRLDDGDNGAVVCSVGEPMLLSAPGGSGKSYLALSWMLAAINGRETHQKTVNPKWAPKCGLQVRTGPVILVSYEDAPARVGARIKAMRPEFQGERQRKDLEKLHLADDPDPLFGPADRDVGGVVALPGPFDSLRQAAERLKPSLIVIDPVSAMAGGANINEGGAARAMMRELARLSKNTGAGVLAIAHDTKAARNQAAAGEAPGAGAVSGSAQWHDAARCVLYLHRGPRDDKAIDRELECIKCNHGRDGWAVPLAEKLGDDGAFQGFKPVGSIWSDYDSIRCERRQREADARKAARGKRGKTPAAGEDDIL